MKPSVTVNKPSNRFVCDCKSYKYHHNTAMNFLESVNSGIVAFNRATQGKLASRAILVHSVLQMPPRAEVSMAMAEVAPDGRQLSESTLRRRLVRTTRQMGLPPLPTGENGGRPSFEVCDQYKMEHCSKWISDNGGMPRTEQLADPNWDLRPQRPSPSGFAPALPAAETPATAKNQSTKNTDQEQSGSQAHRESSIAPPSGAPPTPDQSVVSTEAPTNREERQKAIRKITAGLLRNKAGEIIPPKPSGDLSSITVST